MKKRKKEVQIPDEVLAWEAMGLMSAAGRTPVEHFRACIAAGSTPKFAADLVAMGCGQSSVGTGVTDDVYIQDQNRHGRTILDRYNGDERAVRLLAKNLARHGYALKATDHYVESVARFPGDPEAIVNHGQGLGTLHANLRKQGRTIRGEVEIDAEPTGPRKKKHRLHPRIVERIRKQKIAQEPSLAKADQRALRESIIEKHGSKSEVM